jgi:hypothetical protein
MSKYIYSVMDVAGNIVEEEHRSQMQDVIDVLVENGLIDEDEEIIDEDVQAILIYQVSDNFIRVHYQVDELTGEIGTELTDEYEVRRITR